MTAQRTLFDPGPADGALTPHQAAVYAAAQDAGPRGGITASEAGALVHSRRAVHAAAGRCVHCRGDGRAVLDALKKRGLVKRRKSGVYQPVRAPPGLLPGQTDSIPF